MQQLENFADKPLYPAGGRILSSEAVGTASTLAPGTPFKLPDYAPPLYNEDEVEAWHVFRLAHDVVSPPLAIDLGGYHLIVAFVRGNPTSDEGRGRGTWVTNASGERHQISTADCYIINPNVAEYELRKGQEQTEEAGAIRVYGADNPTTLSAADPYVAHALGLEGDDPNAALNMYLDDRGYLNVVNAGTESVQLVQHHAPLAV